MTCFKVSYLVFGIVFSSANVFARQPKCAPVSYQNHHMQLCATDVEDLGVAMKYKLLYIKPEGGNTIRVFTFRGQISNQQKDKSGLWLTAQKLCLIFSPKSLGFQMIDATGTGPAGLFIQADNNLMIPVITPTDTSGNINIPGSSASYAGGLIQQLNCLKN